jgi:hypothetical protein
MNDAPVFVFGSNLAGRHGKGAALWARQHCGAIAGCGEGPQGNSYAIPTKDWPLKSRALNEIKESVNRFINYAAQHPELQFRLTPVGCGLAGFSPSQIAPMFTAVPDNVILPAEFKAVLGILVLEQLVGEMPKNEKGG